MPKNIRFFKPIEDDNRPKLDFAQIVEHSPELGNRTIAIRSRVKDLREKFHKDCDWALRNFNLVTTVTIALALLCIAVGIVVSLSGEPDASFAAVVSVAVGALAGIVGAASKAFGWHKRYHAMFQAGWAMASLEVQIDSFLCDIALSTKQGEDLSDEHRAALRQALAQWLAQLDAALRTFGDSYGAAISPVEVKQTSE